MKNELGGLKLEKVIYIKVVDEVMVEKMAKNTAQGKKGDIFNLTIKKIISKIESSAWSNITERTEKT